jgi:NADPH:quinone reductase-like Zn-dependent oxidoreductase
LPKYTFAMSLPDTNACVTKTFQLVQEGKLKAVIDSSNSFTTMGVRTAFRKQESRHAHGKVVVHVAGEK